MVNGPSVFGYFFEVDRRLVKNEIMGKMVKTRKLMFKWLFVEMVKKSRLVEGY